MSWIKLRDDVRDDPAVDLIASRCGVTALHAVGALACAWSWAGRLSDDGKVPLGTPALLDKITQTPGFARAMEEAGWLVVESTYLLFPKWDRHNEAGAKARALAAERQRRKRVTPDRDEPVTPPRDQRRGEERREEEKREDQKKNPPTPRKKAAAKPANPGPESIPIPVALDTPEFRPLWAEWIVHRARNDPMTARAAELALMELERWGPTRACAAIVNSLQHPKWTSIYEPKNEQPTNGNRSNGTPRNSRRPDGTRAGEYPEPVQFPRVFRAGSADEAPETVGRSGVPVAAP